MKKLTKRQISHLTPLLEDLLYRVAVNRSCGGGTTQTMNGDLSIYLLNASIGSLWASNVDVDFRRNEGCVILTANFVYGPAKQNVLIKTTVRAEV